MFNSTDDYINKSAERIRALPFGNDNSNSKCRSNFKILNAKSKNYEEDEKLRGNENSPTFINYYPHLLLSNMDENKEKLGETPIRINDVNNDIDWYQGIQARDNMFVDSPLFTRNMNFKSNRNLEISSSIQKMHYCYNPSNLTKKNLSFGIENSVIHSNILNTMSNIYNQENNNHISNYNNYNYQNKNSFQFYQPKKLFNNGQNQYVGISRLQQENINQEKKIIMSSDDDDQVSIVNKPSQFNKNLENISKTAFSSYSPNKNELKDNCILSGSTTLKKENISNNTMETSRNIIKRSIKSEGNFQSKSKKKTKNSLILSSYNIYKENENLLNEKSIELIDEKDISTREKVSKTRCTCSKTQCIKKYCECFSNGKFCVDCDCENCLNVPENNENLNEIRGKEGTSLIKDKEDIIIKQINIVCNCTKSGCKKKYCECFKAGKKCSEECRCIHCNNMDECRLSCLLKKNKKLYLAEKKEISKTKNRNQIQFDDSLLNSSNPETLSIPKRIFNLDTLSLYNINFFICGEIISISEKNEILKINDQTEDNFVIPAKKLDKNFKNNSSKRVSNRKLKKNIQNRNFNNIKKLPEVSKMVELQRNQKGVYPEEVTNIIQDEKNFDYSLLNKSLISEKAYENDECKFRRSARLQYYKNSVLDQEILNRKMYCLPTVVDVNTKRKYSRLNEKNHEKALGIKKQNKTAIKSEMKNIIDDNTQGLDFYSSVLNKEYFDKLGPILSNKNLSIFNLDNCTSITDKKENINEENIINSGSNKKTINKRNSIIENYDSFKKEKIQKITETPKLCEKKRYRNTTTAKTKIPNEDIYIKTNSTMNQTPILHNDENNKKKMIEVDRRIVKNLKY